MESCVQLTSRFHDSGNTYFLSFSVYTPHQWVKDITNKTYRFVKTKTEQNTRWPSDADVLDDTLYIRMKKLMRFGTCLKPLDMLLLFYLMKIKFFQWLLKEINKDISVWYIYFQFKWGLLFILISSIKYI